MLLDQAGADSNNGTMRRGLAALFAAALAGFALVTGATGAASTAPLAQRLARSLLVPHVAATSALAFDLTTGTSVFSQNETRPLEPASNEKLAVTYAALTDFGADFQIETDVLAQGQLVGTTWHGSLVLQGHGDPTLNDAGLGSLAAQVRAAGIRRVAGSVIGDESFFDALRTAPGWKPSFYINQSPALSALTVDRTWFHWHHSGVPALAAATLFRDALKAHGVAVSGRTTTGVASPDAAPLASVLSPPLSAIVRFMDQQSDNFTAELLMKQLGAANGDLGTTAAGAAEVRALLAAANVPLTGVRIVDGSGLSSLDRLTTRAIVAILRAAWSDPQIGPSFVSALAVSGINGTLKDRLRRPLTRGAVLAKTGTTAIASALSGYVRHRYVFSILQNGYPVWDSWARRAQDRFVSVLAAQ